jgi:hypothetical protein
MLSLLTRLGGILFFYLILFMSELGTKIVCLNDKSKYYLYLLLVSFLYIHQIAHKSWSFQLLGKPIYLILAHGYSLSKSKK